MKMTQQIAQQQARRLLTCPLLVPEDKEGRRELEACLLRHCVDEEHAVRTMTAVLDGPEKVISITAEIAKAAYETRNFGKGGADCPPGCPQCELGPDLTTGEMRWQAHVSSELRSGVWGATRCTCERGQWLRSKDEQRRLEKPKARKEERPRSNLSQVADWARAAAGDEEYGE